MIPQRMKWRSVFLAQGERVVNGLKRVIDRHPWLLHLYALLSWAALLYFLSSLFFFPDSRKLGVQFLWSFYVLLQFWWLCRSKTLSWRTFMLFFLAGAWLIVPFTGITVSLLTSWSGGDTGGLWSRALLTPIAEEVFKLIPLGAYLFFSRRASALSLGDYALIGGAVGAGFQFMEETVRRWTTDRAFPYGYNWISGRFIHWNVGDLFPGYLEESRMPLNITYSHAMLGSMAALGIGIAIRLRGRLHRAAAAVPFLLLVLAIFDHGAYNAASDLSPALRRIDSLLGNGYATKPLFLLLLIAAVLYDYIALNRIRRQLPLLERERWLDPLSELIRYVAALGGGQGRLHAQMAFIRQRKRLGFALLYGNEEARLPGPAIRSEVQRLAALLAGAGAVILLLAAVLYALPHAPPDSESGCFACMFESMQHWWDRLSFTQKAAILAGMLALSLLFIEFWPAIGLISTITGFLGSGQSIGAFIRNPRSFMTPGRLAALGVDLVLSRIPFGRLAKRIPGRFGDWVLHRLGRLRYYDIARLKNTTHFRAGSLEHILEGELNRRGRGVGYHYEGMPSAKGRIIPGTESPPNAHGVYQAQVEISGVPKTGNQGMSTFFPKNSSPQQIVDFINEAYGNRTHTVGNTFTGMTSSGMRIDMYLDRNGSIISAFPHY